METFFFFFIFKQNALVRVLLKTQPIKTAVGENIDNTIKMKKQQLDTVLNIDNAENKRKKPSDDCSLEKQKHPC